MSERSYRLLFVISYAVYILRTPERKVHTPKVLDESGVTSIGRPLYTRLVNLVDARFCAVLKKARKETNPIHKGRAPP